MCLLALWTSLESEACQGDELPRELVLDWMKKRILEDLGLMEAPKPAEKRPLVENADTASTHRRNSRRGRGDFVAHRREHKDILEVIVFPRSGERSSYFSGLLYLLLNATHTHRFTLAWLE